MATRERQALKRNVRVHTTNDMREWQVLAEEECGAHHRFAGVRFTVERQLRPLAAGIGKDPFLGLLTR